MESQIKIAIIQDGPVFNDLPASIEKAVKLIREAASVGASLVVFGECWLCGYPAWIDIAPGAAYWDHEPVKKVWARMYHNSLEIPGKDLSILLDTARESQVNIVMGVNEVVRTGKGNGTIYNAIITIDDKGTLRNHHRKLMPTFSEKLVHGTGDGSGLNSVSTSIGNIGSLVCWEHWMPLARQAMHDAGEDIHIALWPSVHEMHQVASRHYAFEGRCYVIAVGQVIWKKDFPPELEQPEVMTAYPYLLNGGSCVFVLKGESILDPQYETEEIIYVDLPGTKHLAGERMNLAVSGHYQRHDVFDLKINRKRN